MSVYINLSALDNLFIFIAIIRHQYDCFAPS